MRIVSQIPFACKCKPLHATSLPPHMLSISVVTTLNNSFKHGFLLFCFQFNNTTTYTEKWCLEFKHKHLSLYSLFTVPFYEQVSKS